MSSRRTWWIVGGIAAALVIAVIAGPLIYAALRGDDPPARSVQAQPEDEELTSTVDGTWQVSAGSSAGYRVHEVLNGADNEVAGTTDQVSGSVVIDGEQLVEAQVQVDVGSITTDSNERDGYFRTQALDVATHPTATFAVTEPADLPKLSGTPVTVPVAGDLTLDGATQPVTAEMSVVRTADGVQVSGSIPVAFEDFGVQPPDLVFVRVDGEGAVEFFLALVPAVGS